MHDAHTFALGVRKDFPRAYALEELSLALIHQRRFALEFLSIKHGNFRLASSTPGHLHGQIIAPVKTKARLPLPGLPNSAFFPYVLASLHSYFLSFAMHRIQRPPKRIQRLACRRQNLFL